jgi:ATP-dependent helicase HrpB
MQTAIFIVQKQGTVSLPIDAILPSLVKCFEGNTLALLTAEAGAGKTTRVPVALMQAAPGDIYVLEPRRIAARMAARRVADELAERVGETVGYQVRFEEVGSRATRLWYVTEGVLTRKLLNEADLPGAGTVILDEFHERHLETDLALSLLLALRRRRPDLKLLIMSATLDAEAIAAKLGNPPVLHSPGRVFPVSVRYTPQSMDPVEQQVARALPQVLKETRRHVLVFLPGAAEIRRTMQACDPIARQNGALLLPLHGELSAEEQDAAVAGSTQRKIICSTNVAESSLTIEGVEAVIDSGTARLMTHSAWSGLSRLELEKVSQASVLQRSGRAGRTGPGLAIRLFPESDFVRRPAQLAPEVTRADLSGMLLQLADAGLRWNSLDWLSTPPEQNVTQASALLAALGAFNEAGAITPLGRKMAALPLHPRLARFVIAAAEMGGLREASNLAARLSEGRIRLDERTQAACATDLEAILAADASTTVRRVQQQISQSAGYIKAGKPDSHALEKALLLAYPDRLARRRNDILLLAAGGSAKLDRASRVQGEFIVAIEIDDRSDRSSPLVRIACDMEPDWLLDFFPDQVETAEEMTWNREAERVEQKNLLKYRQLIIDESSGAPTDAIAAAAMLSSKAMELGIERFTDVPDLTSFLQRVDFAAQHTAIQIPANLVAAALQDLATGLTSFAELRTAGRDGALIKLLEARLPMRQIEQVAPASVQLAAGRKARIEYHQGRPPSVASRLQDFFGMKESPTVARGMVPLVVHLLAPNKRPVQVTTDLASFWKNLYPQVRRELSRRYPRHSWPETPA